MVALDDFQSMLISCQLYNYEQFFPKLGKNKGYSIPVRQ
jgi:hypothetical protein